MKSPMHSNHRGFTWIEVLVAVFVLIILAALTLPALIIRLTHGQIPRIMNNLHQLQLATEQMTKDNTRLGTPIRWTCSDKTPLTFNQWKNALLTGQYISTNDFNKLMICVEEKKFWFSKIITTNSPIVYAVDENDPDNTVLLSSPNWHGITTTNLPYEIDGIKSFIIATKDGNVALWALRQVTNAADVGSGGHFNYLPLK